jgi:hypothetical protein
MYIVNFVDHEFVKEVRLRRRFVHGFRMLSCSLSCFGIEARPWEMHLHLAHLGIIAADDDLLGVGCHQNAGHWIFPHVIWRHADALARDMGKVE